MDGPMDHPDQLQAAMPVDLAQATRDFNALNRAHQSLWARTHRAGDAFRRSVQDWKDALRRVVEARDFHLTLQAEYPHRSAPLAQQGAIAGALVALDAVACWFAAQALGTGRDETLLWTVLFLAVLAGGEIALDHYSENNVRSWRFLVAGLVAFVTGLGVLRFIFLETVSTVGFTGALVGAALFTAATAGSLALGYRALRAAERFPAWQARRWARRAERDANAARNRMARLLRDRNRLVDAYIGRIRISLHEICSSDQLPVVEAALRAHLTGPEDVS